MYHRFLFSVLIFFTGSVWCAERADLDFEQTKISILRYLTAGCAQYCTLLRRSPHMIEQIKVAVLAPLYQFIEPLVSQLVSHGEWHLLKEIVEQTFELRGINGYAALALMPNFTLNDGRSLIEHAQMQGQEEIRQYLQGKKEEFECNILINNIAQSVEFLAPRNVLFELENSDL